jgi:hypothetical protein
MTIQVMFLTGQSDPGRCALSPVQQAFLDALPLPAAAKVPVNFPYLYSDTMPWRTTPIVVASVRNAWQYLASRRSAFAATCAPGVRAQLARAQKTLILAGSNGLELFANLRLPREVLARVEVFAYGPVARRLPECPCSLVQGRRDWLSRAWCSRVDYRVGCGHLDYLESPEVLALCVAVLNQLAARDAA